MYNVVVIVNIAQASHELVDFYNIQSMHEQYN